MLIEDVDLLHASGTMLLRLRGLALELYAEDLPITLVISASPRLFAQVRCRARAAHPPLRAGLGWGFGGCRRQTGDHRALAGRGVLFADDVDEIIALSGGRPYYLQKLGYHGFEAASNSRLSASEFAVAFERAFASVSQEIFAARRWLGDRRSTTCW